MSEWTQLAVFIAFVAIFIIAVEFHRYTGWPAVRGENAIFYAWTVWVVVAAGVGGYVIGEWAYPSLWMYDLSIGGLSLGFGSAGFAVVVAILGPGNVAEDKSKVRNHG